MRFRQVHLDFHTFDAIEEIGRDYSDEQFQRMLKLGHVDSITLFAKCHHGWSYHPTRHNEMHPGLGFDLLGSMMRAAREIGVQTPVYLSVTVDEKLAHRRPEWLVRDETDRTCGLGGPRKLGFKEPGWHVFCLNSPFLELFLLQLEEVVRLYDPESLFLDIAAERTCYCHHCRQAIRESGGDPFDPEAVAALKKRVYANYAGRVRACVDAIKPGVRIFHNGGHIPRGRRDLIAMNSHLELESLPTAFWGYDHFPLSIRYAQGLGLDCLGMTGKFHTWWGEFGGFKHPNALRYEAACCLANGARCSIGDQLHPYGRLDEATYALIGAAYEEVEAKEAWCRDTRNIADVALLSLESVGLHHGGEMQAGNTADSDAGAVRILLEGNILFDVIDLESDLSRYKVIVLPDRVVVDDRLLAKLNDFLQKGGKVLASGLSGLDPELRRFRLPLGVERIGEMAVQPSYFRPYFPLKSLRASSFVMYAAGQRVAVNEGTELGCAEDSFFNREAAHFCSHQHAPSRMEHSGPGMVLGKGGIYMAWNAFEDYAVNGSLAVKEMVLHALDLLLGEDKRLTTDLPAQGVITLQEQAGEGRLVNHLLYASPVQRGKHIGVIEDLPVLSDIHVRLQPQREVKRVYLAPQMTELPWEREGPHVAYTVPRLEGHQMVVLEYR